MTPEENPIIEDLADLQARENEIPAGTTHIVWIYTGDKAAMLFRASDGMMLGMKKQETVVFGENKNRGQSRVFIDQKAAEAWLKKLAQYDMRAQANGSTIEDEITKPLTETYPVQLIERVKDSIVQLAEGSIEIPSGGVHPIRGAGKKYN
jgi:hypothetical protein